MKKVICIQDTFQGRQLKGIKFGVVYTASQCQVYPNNYDILEVTMVEGRPVSYRKFLFADISDIDETELAKQREELQTA